MPEDYFDRFNDYGNQALEFLRAHDLYHRWAGSPTDLTIENQYDLTKTLLQNYLDERNYNRYMEDISPKSQMDRYLKAGLNPNLIYGQISGGNPDSPLQQSAPTIKGGETADVMNKTMQITSAIAQIGSLFGDMTNTVNNIAQFRGINAQSDLMTKRLNALKGDGGFYVTKDEGDGNIHRYTNPGFDLIDLGNGWRISPETAFLFPEIVNAWQKGVQSQNISAAFPYLDEYFNQRNVNLKGQEAVNEKNARIDTLIDNIIHKIGDKNYRTSEMLPDFMQLLLLKLFNTNTSAGISYKLK